MSETPAKATPAAPDQGADTTTDAATEPGAPVKTRRFPWVRVGIALTLVGLVAAAASLDHWRGPARATLAASAFIPAPRSEAKSRASPLRSGCSVSATS